ncbi:CoF synthetase [uncultured Aquimarina sp.]|uniref:CoF synthetase n=1 Tax=uncultured Aquimarina sp. TaxID=575652 RepID=UPI00261C1F95|nr:CoF synthetase [uncultured Aquimarina sp.]
MRFNERIRNIIFWFVDFINGGSVRKHYNDVKSLIEYPEKESTVDKQKLYLDLILKHASKTSPFYKTINPADLQNFLVINKEIVKSAQDKFQSVEYVKRKKVAVYTSGSTGASFTVYQDLNKKARNTADIVYFSELAGFEVGYRLFYLRFWNMFKEKSMLMSLIQNVVSVNVFDLSPLTIKKMINIISKSKSNKGMIGYASSFNKICKYLDVIESENIEGNVKSVIGISERLEPYTKLAMKKYFNVDMVSRYSNAENGMIAQQPLSKEYFKINWASYYVEILNFDNDNTTENGVLGRIVITDLFNYNEPMIRYDTGDIGIMDSVIEDDKEVLVLTKIEGRKMDMIKNTAGEILSTSILLLINKYEEIEQRQIIQKTKNEYVFKLKIDNQYFTKEKEFIREFKGYLGQDAIIKLLYVEEIPLLVSGKQRAIVNEVDI